ncbi:hypothetical protein [Cryptosporangium sp. NPDC051539]|uniref:hypothetical protein n=1 Tax=Cryptosporangium sp. NPDC051539 TaxID=3363962 RepID=UPI0037A27AE8
MPGSEADEAAALTAAVRDDPHARLALAARYYEKASIRSYRRAELAFMHWQLRRGVLAPDTGSPWWRAVNESLLRDAIEGECRHRTGRETDVRLPVRRWIEFLRGPSPRTWYRAHNSSIIAGYVEHRELAEAEKPAERFFMDVAMIRVLYADSLLSDPRLAAGRFARLAPWLGDPRRKWTGVFLSLHNILPGTYPLPDEKVGWFLARENRLGHLIDYGVILPRAQRLYEHASRDLGHPEVLDMVREGHPIYAWPGDPHEAWSSDATPASEPCWAGPSAEPPDRGRTPVAVPTAFGRAERRSGFCPHPLTEPAESCAGQRPPPVATPHGAPRLVGAPQSTAGSCT